MGTTLNFEHDEPELTYGIVASGPPVSLAEVEAPEDAIEVVMMWGANVLHVAHVPEGESFVVGESDDVDFLMGREALGVARLTLIDEGRLQVPAGSIFESEAFEGIKTLSHGDEVIFERGGMRFVVRHVHAGKKIAAGSNLDRRPFAYVGGALGLAGIMLLMTSLVPPSSSALSLELLNRDSRLVAALMEPAIIEFDEPEPMDGVEPAGGDGERAAGDEGQAGAEDNAVTHRRFGVEGPADNQDEHLARENVEQMVRNAGVLGTLRTMTGSWNTITSPFGQETALGSDPMNALGSLMGTDIGDDFGFGGLGLHGTGRGANGNGLGTVGLGDYGTIGHGAGCRGERCGQGYGRGHGTLRTRTSRGPTITGGDTTITGALSREVIRRVVRRHRNEVKFCYEQGLQSRPDLEGRVTTRFIISPTGAVTTALVASSSVNHQPTERCIAQAVRRWTFPSPDGGGVVSVSYPFVLQSR